MEEMGIISKVSFGMRDSGVVALWFTVKTLHGDSLQCLPLDEAASLIKRYYISDINTLNGKPCKVSVEGGAL